MISPGEEASTIEEDYERSNFDFDEKYLSNLTEIIRKKTGIVFNDSRQHTLKHKLDRRLRQLEMHDLKAYRDYLFENTRDEIPKLISEVSTNETSFYREEKHWTFLQNHILSDPSEFRRFNVWSAACSSGEEPYTAAMCIEDRIDTNFPNRILATDISRSALKKGVRGVYSASAFKKLKKSHPEWIEQYFTRIGEDRWKLNESIRRSVPFREFNLTSDDYPFRETFDLIICRNVFLYFEDSTIKHILRQLNDAMCTGGYLFISHTESLADIDTPFERIRPSIFRLV